MREINRLLVPESSYPTTFRTSDTQAVLHYISQHQSVTIVGMKRVGVSNFLRFITFNKAIQKQIENGGQFVFLYLDANDLADITVKQFWLLVLKRLFDETDRLPESSAKQMKAIYEQVLAGNTDEMLFLLEAAKEMAAVLLKENFYLTIILSRFDRLLPLFSEQFFANLQSVIDLSQEHINYVFTSYLPLQSMYREIHLSASFSMLTKTYYLKPGTAQDVMPIIAAFEHKRQVCFPDTIKALLIRLTGGHVQLLQLCLIMLSEQHTSENVTEATLRLILGSDERIMLQCDEIFESLTHQEQTYLLAEGTNRPDPTEYLLETGIVTDHTAGTIFSPLFDAYLAKKRLESRQPSSPYGDLTKKELLLLNYFIDHKGEICSRDNIILAVWPEFEDISDWALDQLVSRLRRKLDSQQVPMKIKTNRGVGYQLVE